MARVHFRSRSQISRQPLAKSRRSHSSQTTHGLHDEGFVGYVVSSIVIAFRSREFSDTTGVPHPQMDFSAGTGPAVSEYSLRRMPMVSGFAISERILSLVFRLGRHRTKGQHSLFTVHGFTARCFPRQRCPCSPKPQCWVRARRFRLTC